MNKYKWFAIVAYPFIAWGLLSQFPDGTALLGIAAIVSMNILFAGWVCMIYVFATCYFTKWSIQRKLEKAKLHLGRLSTAEVMTYKPKGNYATLRIWSAGASEQEWEAKRADVQSAINYTILGTITHDPKDWGIIVFNARKGCPQSNAEVLSDDEL